MKKEIPIMFCFDNNYVIPAAVAFYSLLEHANKNYRYKLYVLHSDISDNNIKMLFETVSQFSTFSELEFIDMSHKFNNLWERIRTKGHFSKEVMYKVLVSSIFPQYEKIIVSDVDVVFLGDISESYTEFNTNDDYYLAGVRPVGKVMYYMNNYRPNFNESEIEALSSFCGGYIVFNLKKLREDKMEKKFIKCFEKNAYRLNQMEQDVLTLCCYPKVKFLSLSYVACSYMWDMYKSDIDFHSDVNYSEKELRESMSHPIQLHYATSIKPWKNVDITKSEEWFKYIVKTPFLGLYLSELPQKIIIPPKEGLSEIKRLTKKLIFKQLSRIRRLLEAVLFVFKKDPLIIFKKDFYKRVYKKISFWSRNNKLDLLILDDNFPLENSSFRYYEFITYLYEFNNSEAILTKGLFLNDINETIRENNKNIDFYLSNNPIFKGRILTDPKSKKAKLAILVFLNNVYENLSYLENSETPFVFTLYPGGGFAINDSDSDKKLAKVFSSRFFRKVIVTQSITLNYLIKNNLCSNDKIEYIYGGVVNRSMLSSNQVDIKRFGKNKKTLDVCFVGHKYMKKGLDKGYDVFIEFAKLINMNHNNIRFHVVGEFTEDDIDVSELKNRIKFYGVKPSSWFLDFYKDKDLIVSPNRPFVLSDGSFDGFPLTCSVEAMLNGVAVFCTDDLSLNEEFIDGKDLIIIKHDANDILNKVQQYYKKPDSLLLISKNGRSAALKNYSYKKQLAPRIKLIKEELKKMKKRRLSI